MIKKRRFPVNARYRGGADLDIWHICPDRPLQPPAADRLAIDAEPFREKLRDRRQIRFSDLAKPGTGTGGCHDSESRLA